MSFIAEFTDNHGFNARLTSEKLYITSTGSQETFALRSVAGIGVYDDIKEYNENLREYDRKSELYEKALNSNRQGGIIFFILGIIALFPGLAKGDMQEIFIVISIILVFFGIIFYNQIPKYDNPTHPAMNSYFRIILVGGERSFQFNKNEVSATKIGVFINALEDTLTAYNNS
jgi:hypothetical protein